MYYENVYHETVVIVPERAQLSVDVYYTKDSIDAPILTRIEVQRLDRFVDTPPIYWITGHANSKAVAIRTGIKKFDEIVGGGIDAYIAKADKRAVVEGEGLIQL